MEALDKTITDRALFLRQQGLSFYRIAKVLYGVKDPREARRKAWMLYSMVKKRLDQGDNIFGEEEGIYSVAYNGGERDPLGHRQVIPRDRIQDKFILRGKDRQVIEYEEFLIEIIRELRLRDNVLWDTIRYLHHRFFEKFYSEHGIDITRQKHGYTYKRKDITPSAAYAYVIISVAGLLNGYGMIKHRLKEHLMQHYVRDPGLFRRLTRKLLLMILPEILG